MKIAILALQGAFAEHAKMMQQLGHETFEVRQLADWNNLKMVWLFLVEKAQ